jgi:hypothetical protein
MSLAGRALALAALLAALGATALGLSPAAPSGTVTVSDHQIQDGIRGGWAGAVIGGAWGEPTEFRFNGRIVPRDRVPRWSAKRANRYTFATPSGPDETYVEVPFLRAIRADLGAGWPEWGAALRRTRFPLFAENRRARSNLRAGIPPPGPAWSPPGSPAPRSTSPGGPAT